MNATVPARGTRPADRLQGASERPERLLPLLSLVAALLVAAAGSGATATAAPPGRLSETGLPGVRGGAADGPLPLSYTPQYPLWSDGASKRRWIQLPRGAFIDASNPRAWEFPAGTKFWKEFAFGDRRVETRMIERLADGSWQYSAYVWTDDGLDAELAPVDGIPALAVEAAPGGRYAIPSHYDCRACHEGSAVPVLGFSALQLSPDRDALAPHAGPADPADVDLRELVELGLIRNLPTDLLDVPPRIAARSPVERAALGYLHGNCGHCHSVPDESGAGVPVEALLAQDVTNPASSERVLHSLVGNTSRFRPAGLGSVPQLVAPGDASHSVLAIRMRSRDPRTQMPPLGTAIQDSDGLALIERWINEELQLLQETQP